MDSFFVELYADWNLKFMTRISVNAYTTTPDSQSRLYVVCYSNENSSLSRTFVGVYVTANQQMKMITLSRSCKFNGVYKLFIFGVDVSRFITLIFDTHLI